MMQINASRENGTQDPLFWLGGTGREGDRFWAGGKEPALTAGLALNVVARRPSPVALGRLKAGGD